MKKRSAAALALWAALSAVVSPQAGAQDPSPVPGNRVAVPLSVRQNLGITFAKVERRSVAATLRLPGRFELKPTARREYLAPAEGRVEILVDQYQQVEVGTPLFSVQSPSWRRLKAEMAEAQLSASMMRSRLEAHERHHAAVEARVEAWKQRIEQLAKLSEHGLGAQSEVSEARVNLATAEAELADAVEDHEAMRLEAVPFLGDGGEAETNSRFLSALEEAAAVLATTPEKLAEEVDGQPRWRTIDSIVVRAAQAGVVEKLPATQGSLVEGGALVASVVDPRSLRFRIAALQSDMSRIKEGAAVRIGPMDDETAEAVAGTLSHGLEADPVSRTIDLIVEPDLSAGPPWARAGVAAVAEVVIQGGGRPELAVPRRAVIQDGLQRILFRRDPNDADAVLRLEADAGTADGRWIEILSGLAEGDEVVVGGVYELMLGSSTDGAREEGGHFHSDGSFHEAH